MGLPILMDGASPSAPRDERFVVFLHANECWVGTDDRKPRLRVERVLLEAGIIQSWPDA